MVFPRRGVGEVFPGTAHTYHQPKPKGKMNGGERLAARIDSAIRERAKLRVSHGTAQKMHSLADRIASYPQGHAGKVADMINAFADTYGLEKGGFGTHSKILPPIRSPRSQTEVPSMERRASRVAALAAEIPRVRLPLPKEDRQAIKEVLSRLQACDPIERQERGDLQRVRKVMKSVLHHSKPVQKSKGGWRLPPIRGISGPPSKKKP